MISLAIAVALIGMCLAYWGVRQVNEWRESRGQILGGALAELGKGVNSYVVHYHPQIVDALFASSRVPLVVNGEQIAADTIRPTAAEIAKFAGMSGFGDRPPAVPRGSYRIELRKGSECNVKEACNVNALTYVDKPLLLPYPGAIDRVDYMAAAAAARTIGINGGVSILPDNSKLTFPDSAGTSIVTLDNPVKDAPGGIVAVRGGYLRADFDEFLRRDGTRPMTGNLNMGANSINDVKDIKGEGSLQMRSVTTTESLNTFGNIAALGNLIIGRAASVGTLSAAGRISTKEYVQLGGMAVEGESCDPDGLVARTSKGALLSCQSKRWHPGGFSQTITVKALAEACGFHATRTSPSQASIAYCPAGFRLVAGGYYVTGWPPFLAPGQRNYAQYTFSPEESAPLDFYDSERPDSDAGKSRQQEQPIDLSNREGWYIWTGDAQGGCWRAVATCTQ
ncbi:shufflon system plasmid conjugative transfer pilus tip adhesin PilV [Chromobacterium vaccinii]|uniref:shufflon system plasmid conjugative transfer pilus tip adhesin PilV n=1 Tax=Chromobacterium vaccinii TaxID=1108595 RepID=UPI0016428AFC|nr:shufflon system plasmid conjugative transfer pilus tip adhesin PilV [Chromobacterium vaccinii]